LWLELGRTSSDVLGLICVGDRQALFKACKTGLPMILAEELDADWSKVRSVHGSNHPAYADPVFGRSKGRPASSGTSCRAARIASNRPRKTGPPAVSPAFRATRREFIPLPDTPFRHAT